MICMFLGHKDTPDSVKPYLKEAILKLITERGIKQFYVGNNGNFDFYAQRMLKEIAQTHTEVEYGIVLSYIHECAIGGEQEATLYPEGLESTPLRFCISKRNEWLLKRSDFLIAYVAHKFSNSYKWLERARKRGLHIINLAQTMEKVLF